MTDVPKSTNPNFDMRLKYNEGLGLLMQQLTMARAMGMNDVSYRLLRSLTDFVPYLTKKEQEEIDACLNRVSTGLIIMQSMNVRDPQLYASQYRYKFLVEEYIGRAQRLLFKAMGEHGMLLPLRIDDDEEMTDEQIASMMGL